MAVTSDAGSSGYTFQSEPLLAGDAGTHQTIERIRALVEEGKKDPFVNRLTGAVLRSSRPRQYDDESEIRALYEWVRRNIRFVKDPDGKEVLRPARTTLEWGFGDCDDINAILLPSLLGAAGHRTRLVTIAAHPRAPRTFTHVYCEALLGGRWVPLDAARRDASFGSEPARQFRKRVWSLVADEHADLRGLSGCAACTTPPPRPALGRFVPALTVAPARRTLGRYYPSAGLGFNWDIFGQAVDKVSGAVTNVIAAARSPYGYGYPPPPVGLPGYPPAVSASGGITASNQNLLLLGLGVVALVLFARR